MFYNMYDVWYECAVFWYDYLGRHYLKMKTDSCLYNSIGI